MGREQIENIPRSVIINFRQRGAEMESKVQLLSVLLGLGSMKLRGKTIHS